MMNIVSKNGPRRILQRTLLAVLMLAGVHMIGQGIAKPAAGSTTPAEYRKGEAKFKANCVRCHGESAVGTSQGPPLVHKIYEPNHHGDAAFQRAAANGVRAHHWRFGDMPRIEGVTPEDVDQIIQYVRWLQRETGIK
jgi:mono/diheme cytochrome c family protein